MRKPYQDNSTYDYWNIVMYCVGVKNVNVRKFKDLVEEFQDQNRWCFSVMLIVLRCTRSAVATSSSRFSSVSSPSIVSTRERNNFLSPLLHSIARTQRYSLPYNLRSYLKFDCTVLLFETVVLFSVIVTIYKHDRNFITHLKSTEVGVYQFTSYLQIASRR